VTWKDDASIMSERDGVGDSNPGELSMNYGDAIVIDHLRSVELEPARSRGDESYPPLAIHPRTMPR
jgi:hypothetical protein